MLKQSLNKLVNPIFYIPLSIFIAARIGYFIYNFYASYHIIEVYYVVLVIIVVISIFIGHVSIRKYRRTGRSLWLIVGLILTFILPGIAYYLFAQNSQADLDAAKNPDPSSGVMCYFYTYSIFHRSESPKLDQFKRDKMIKYSSVIPHDIYKKLKT